MYKKFIAPTDPPKPFFDALGSNRDYNVDLIPKFILAGGSLVRMLVQTDVTRYLDFKLVDGSYVYKKASPSTMLSSATPATICKVPASTAEALTTGLVGFLQKRRLKSFLEFVGKYDPKNRATWDGVDPATTPMSAVYAKFSFEADTAEFVGHAMALQPNEAYLAQPAGPTLAALRLYGESLDKYGKSPFIYPVYGLGGLPEGFSRLCAIHGGTFILNKEVDEVLFNSDGTVAGVRSGGGSAEGAPPAEVALAPLVIGDPSYFAGTPRVRKTGRVIRTLCILDHPVKGLESPDSAQIILPSSQVGRKNDISISVLGAAHAVTAKGKYAAIVSTRVEGSSPKPADEVAPGLALLGALLTRFDNVTETFEPSDDGVASKCFITSSYSASSHLEEEAEEVLSLYERIMGAKLDLSGPVDTPLGGPQ